MRLAGWLAQVQQKLGLVRKRSPYEEFEEAMSTAKAIDAFAWRYLDYDDRANIGFEKNERWIKEAKSFGPAAIQIFERVILSAFPFKPRGCRNLLYAIYRIGGPEAISSLEAMRQGRLSDGTPLPQPTNSDHLQFLKSGEEWYQDLTAKA